MIAAAMLSSAALAPAIASAKQAPKLAPLHSSFNWGQAATNVVGGTVNVLFGGSYGGGGHPFGSDAGTWWSALSHH